MHQYDKIVIDRVNAPLHDGTVVSPDGQSKVESERSGSIMMITLTVKGESISDIRCKTLGNVAAIYVGEIIGDIVKGRNVEECLALKKEEIHERIKGLVPEPEEMDCVELGAKALREAIRDYMFNYARAKKSLTS